MTDRRSRVLNSILGFAVMAGAMPIGLGVPVDVPHHRRLAQQPTEEPARLPPSPAVVARRKQKRATRKSRKGRK